MESKIVSLDQILDQEAVGGKMLFEMTQKTTQRDDEIVFKRKETMELMDGGKELKIVDDRFGVLRVLRREKTRCDGKDRNARFS